MWKPKGEEKHRTDLFMKRCPVALLLFWFGGAFDFIDLILLRPILYFKRR